MNYHKGFISPLLLALIALLLIGGGAYVYVQNKQANQPIIASLSDEQTLQIVQDLHKDLYSRAGLACLSFNNKKADGYVIYDVTRKFTNGCPGDPTSTPTIPSLKINLTTGEIFIQSLDGVYRPVETSNSSKVNASVPIINSIATSNDHGAINIIISGSNFIDRSVVEYLSNGKYVDGFCGYLVNNGVLTHSWGAPESGWGYYSNINQLRVINADCRTFDVKSDRSSYPTSAIVNISMIGNFPTLK